MRKKTKTQNNVQNAIYQEALAISMQDEIDANNIAIQQAEIYNNMKALQAELKRQLSER